ncbi:DUF6912 family protein [Cellulomonas marina]|uniref:Uncharacterized protein n=1 Tax=Cellulomonas marina TaxID=988821 RepID=A0A1I0V0X4_9CELL|nr:hypothetical protein [Cellulomonas marina]GIG28245.1 hypothetical protein Cma02nite_08450 [Cellulomonas marina]SFA69892.1 hypothetical protein SAMN05421867_10172 [Cellulomonas marina]
MRLYVPATLDETGPGRGPLTPRRAHAVTPELRAALPDEDEGWEFSAQLAAADDALVRLAADGAAPRLRLVVSADVPDADVDLRPDPDAPPSAVALRSPLPWDAVVCVHVDEPAAAPDVTAALAGDSAADERLGERDLLWYDASEVADIPR